MPSASSFAGLSLDRGWFSTLLYYLASGGIIAALSFLIIEQEIRLALTLVLALTFVAFALKDIRLATIATLVYLIVMGDLRRMLIPLVGWSGTDPLLLIGPAYAVITVAAALVLRKTQFNTTLAPWILALMAVMILQIFNPRQGGMMVGVAGALFYIVPLLWYWIGQSFASTGYVHTVLYRVILPLGGVAIIMGLYQVFYGYLPYQEMWFQCCAYTALDSAGIQAPISLFASSIEYSLFSLIAATILWVRFLLKKDYAALLAIIPFLVASFLMGSRGPIAQFLVMAAALWAVLADNVRTWILRGLVGVIVGGTLLVTGLNVISKQATTISNDRVQFRMQRQADGFLNIADPDKSTATIHLMMMIHGFSNGITNPLGNGLGSTTQAAHKFKSGVAGSSEVDMSNLFLSTGVVGGTLYLIIVFLTIKQSIQYWSRSHSVVALCIAGILALTFLNWLEGGRYAVTTIVWFLIGVLDRLNAEHSPPSDLSTT
ncbi:hypothetical protein BSZ35_08240 [Salinibacter sp. 10B]|uniref:hypothetical protein n=1 Tax=Salinibacter sp. 10B TaxID=1923971 RepID=UPI000CF43C94|nr:hypothetical protein [Salinibacter sp. 10B]PQJ34589.1 hypothetical protein BSZ35_08240 [Salinibacter sp. 10B]